MLQDKLSAAAYATSGTTILFGLTASDLAALVGAVGTIITVAANLYFKWRAHRRAERLSGEK